MADDITFKLTGLDDAVKRIQQFAPKLQKKGLRVAARKAMNIVRDAARENAKQIDDPETPIKIYKFITTAENSRRSKQVGGVVMRVGVKGGAKITKQKDSPWYFGVIEFGKENQPAQPFLRPALSQNIQQVTDKFVTELNAEINKIT